MRDTKTPAAYGKRIKGKIGTRLRDEKQNRQSM